MMRMPLNLFRRLRPRRRAVFGNRGVENLESRTLLSGNVNVGFDGDDIRVIGNADGNEIEVSGAGGILTFTGVNGTTINHGSTPFQIDTNATEYRDLRFAMLGGNDIVNLSGETGRSPCLAV